MADRIGEGAQILIGTIGRVDGGLGLGLGFFVIGDVHRHAGDAQNRAGLIAVHHDIAGQERLIIAIPVAHPVFIGGDLPIFQVPQRGEMVEHLGQIIGMRGDGHKLFAHLLNFLGAIAQNCAHLPVHIFVAHRLHVEHIHDAGHHFGDLFQKRAGFQLFERAVLSGESLYGFVGQSADLLLGILGQYSPIA